MKSLWNKFKNAVYPIEEHEVKSSVIDNYYYDSGILTLGGSYGTYNYLPVTTMNILGVATALRCISVIADNIAQTPFNILIKNGRTIEKATKHPLYRLLDYAPNEWQDTYEFMQMIGLRIALQGEIVIWKVTAFGEIRQLIPFPMERVDIRTEYDSRGFERKIYLLQKDDGSITEVQQKDVWHIKRLNVWRTSALQVDRICQVAINMALSSNDYMKSFVDNGLHSSGILTSKQQLNKEQYDAIVENIKKQNAGYNKAGKVLVLSSEFSFEKINSTNEDAQFMQNLDILKNDICCFFGVPPYMVYHYKENSSYSSSEHATLTFITNTLAPIYRCIEKGALKNLLSFEDYKKGYYFKFNEKALLRMDAKTQAEVLRTKTNIGMYTINESRELEELPPVDGGDTPLVQGAMIKLTDVGAAYNIQPQTNNNNNQAEDTEKSSEKDNNLED